MPPVFEVAFDVRAGLGEGALWDWRRGALVSVDILAGRLLVGDPDSGSTHEIAVGQPVGAALLQREESCCSRCATGSRGSTCATTR